MTNRFHRTYCLALTAALLLTMAFLAHASSTCTTTYDRWLKTYNTRCTDGTTATQSYDRWLKQDRIDIREPGGGHQTCTQTYDRWLKQWRTTCR